MFTTPSWLNGVEFYLLQRTYIFKTRVGVKIEEVNY